MSKSTARIGCVVAGAVSAALALAGTGTAHAQNASLTVYMKAAGSGSFNNSGSISTQVNVFAVSGLAAKYDGSPNLYAPSGVAGPGTAFNLTVPNLYSPAVAPMNTYQIRLSWTDNVDKQLTMGFYTLNPGMNSLGAGGLGSTTPIDITNDPPPAATNLSCYPDLPDRSTQLYVYWSGVLLAKAKDLNRTQLHMSRNAGFTPSAATLIATPPYGTDYRKLTGLLPATGYYFCVRVIDNYGAYTDTCSATPCTTAMSMGTGSDGGTTSDGGSGSADGGGGGSDDGGAGSDDAGSGSDDAGNGNGNDVMPIGNLAIGCGCSLASTSPTPGLVMLLPAAALFILRRRRRQGQPA